MKSGKLKQNAVDTKIVTFPKFAEKHSKMEITVSCVRNNRTKILFSYSTWKNTPNTSIFTSVRRVWNFSFSNFACSRKMDIWTSELCQLIVRGWPVAIRATTSQNLVKIHRPRGRDPSFVWNGTWMLCYCSARWWVPPMHLRILQVKLHEYDQKSLHHYFGKMFLRLHLAPKWSDPYEVFHVLMNDNSRGNIPCELIIRTILLTG